MNKRISEAKIGSELDYVSREAYNLLRTNVKFSVPKREGCRIIATTSPCPQEGKSVSVINLAFSLANNGERVLLIDADMRRPSVAVKLNLTSVPGLSNILIGEDVESAVHKGVLHENLSVITAGEIPPNPSELIGSNMMVAFLATCAENYDYILIDLPPVMAVSDPLVLAPHLDGVIVVLRHGHTHRRDALETVRQLKFANAHILGFVYNGLPGEKTGYYHTKYKQYYSSYTKSSADPSETE